MVKDFTIGNTAEKQVFLVGKHTISDTSGEMWFAYDGDIAPYVGKACIISGVIKPGKDRKPVMAIRTISVAEKGSFDPKDIYVGLTSEKIEAYKTSILGNLRHFRSEGYKRLIGFILNDITLSQLSVLPATISSYGLYRGGALASTANITEMVKKIGSVYISLENGMYVQNVDWDVLLSASLLSSYGMIDYAVCDESGVWQKTPVGVERGYVLHLISKLEKINWEHNFLTDEQMARLVNVISVAAGQISQRPGICPTSKEGLILTHAIQAYKDLDLFDYEASKVAEDKPYQFSTKTNKYIGGQAV